MPKCPNFTPGPWIAVPWTDGVSLTIAGQDGWPLASVTGRGDIDRPNAYLIAAAPELLAACETALDELNVLLHAYDRLPEDDPRATLEAAIAKAVGGKNNA